MRWFGFFLLLSIGILGVSAQAQGPSCGEVFIARGEALTIPFLTWENMTSVQPLNRGNFLASWGSKPVFLKRLKGSSSSEASWLRYLNSMNLGIKFYGEILHEGQTYLVMERFDGVNSQIAMMAPESFQITKSMAQEIKRQAEVLASQKIIPVDLQFQMTSQGEVKIIDPELFQQAPSIEVAQKETENILNNLFLSWLMEGKLEH